MTKYKQIAQSLRACGRFKDKAEAVRIALVYRREAQVRRRSNSESSATFAYERAREYIALARLF